MGEKTSPQRPSGGSMPSESDIARIHPGLEPRRKERRKGKRSSHGTEDCIMQDFVGNSRPNSKGAPPYRHLMVMQTSSKCRWKATLQMELR